MQAFTFIYFTSDLVFNNKSNIGFTEEVGKSIWRSNVPI